MIGDKSAAVLIAVIAFVSAGVTAPEAGAAPNCDIKGTNGPDNIPGTPQGLVICTYGGNDVINGGGGNDLIYAGEGADRVYGGDGDDRIYGGWGNDRLEGREGNDILDGGRGWDVLLGQHGSDRIFARVGRDRLYGGVGRDLLYASDDMKDRVDGGSGTDCARIDRGLDVAISVQLCSCIGPSVQRNTRAYRDFGLSAGFAPRAFGRDASALCR